MSVEEIVADAITQSMRGFRMGFVNGIHGDLRNSYELNRPPDLFSEMAMHGQVIGHAIRLVCTDDPPISM